MSECAGKEAGKEKQRKAVREVLGRIKNRAREKRGKKRIHSLSSLSFHGGRGEKKNRSQQQITPHENVTLQAYSFFYP